MLPRRSFLKTSGSLGALAALAELGFLSQLPAVAADEAAIKPDGVRFHPDIEPLVRLLEETPRERVLEEVAHRIRKGTSYREVLAALLLAGVREIQPRPVGFKFHAVLVVNSAHLASLAAPDTDRWLPILWAIDQFKSSQAADVKEGNWRMAPVDEATVPPGHRARAAFIEAMDNWDEAAADAAVVGFARSAGAGELFDVFCRYGARDFRDIGHKAIYVANSFRTLEAIGWHHAEPVLRSLAYALLDRSGAKENPAKADLEPDRPFRKNLETVKDLRADWHTGAASPDATRELLDAMRGASAPESTAAAVKVINRGIAPRAVFDAVFMTAGEMLMQAPGIVSLHAVTFTNAIHYAWHRAQTDETRRLLLLQNAAFMPLYRGKRANAGARIDALEPLAPTAKDDDAVAEIFADLSTDRLKAARKIMTYLQNGGSHHAIADAARRLTFAKGTNAHDYKYSSAVLEDYEKLSPEWRAGLLAASAFYFKGSGDKDTELVQRARSALTS
jgi:hypothetical protein